MSALPMQNRRVLGRRPFTVPDDRMARRLPRSAFLLRAAGRLASSLDAIVLASRAVRLGVPELGHYCLIDLIDGRGSLVRVAAAHVDPRKEPRLHSTNGLMGGRGERTPSAGRPDALVRPLPDGPVVFDRVLPLARSSWLSVPLTDRGRPLGVMTFVFEDASGAHGREERVTARQLARLVARALGNARLLREARSEVSARDDLLAAVSHDLRSPLARIYLLTDQLEGAVAPAQRQHVDTLRRSTRYMNRMIQDLLQLRQIEVHGLVLDRTRQDLGDVVREAVEMLEASEAGTPRGIVVDLPPSLPGVMIDRHRIVQALSNLLENAVKARPEGLELTVQVEQRGADVCLSVRDNGCGISTTDLPHVFDRYWQASRTDRRGIGIGLAIARAVAEGHGGTLQVTSELGVGTTFVMTLPVEQPGLVLVPGAPSLVLCASAVEIADAPVALIVAGLGSAGAARLTG